MVEIELIQQGSPDYLREMTSTAPLPHIYFSQAVIFKTTMVIGGGHTLGLEASMHRKTQTLGSILFSFARSHSDLTRFVCLLDWQFLCLSVTVCLHSSFVTEEE